jgi:D-aminopeptidase
MLRSRKPLVAALVLLLAALSVGAAGLQSNENAQVQPPRVLLLYDFEGASGVLNGKHMNPQRPDDYAVGRESLIRDVRTVVDALFEAGASAVDIQNTHGDLNPDLVPGTRLDPRVRIRPRQQFTIYHPDEARDFSARYDAIVAIGMHSKPLGGGFSPHTVGAGLSPYINGRTLTETELIGFSVGTVGLPVIFVSGDAHLQRQLVESMPWVEYAVVKHSVSADSAQPIPASQVHAELRERTLTAIRGLGRMRPLSFERPMRAGLLATFPHELPPGLKSGQLPGIAATGDTVWFEALDYRAAWMGIRVLMTIAQGRNAQRSLGFLQQRPEAQAALQTLRDSTDAEWIRLEARAAVAK